MDRFEDVRHGNRRAGTLNFPERRAEIRGLATQNRSYDLDFTLHNLQHNVKDRSYVDLSPSISDAPDGTANGDHS